MNAYYVLRMDAEFKIIYMDEESAKLWIAEGWQVHPYDTNHDAQLAMAEWKDSNMKSNLLVMKRPA
jgi:hypothetical protein